MNSVLDIFIELAKIPSQSLKEDSVADKIIEILNSLEIENSKDNYPRRPVECGRRRTYQISRKQLYRD